LQSGVTNEKGPTLDDIHADESRQEAELKAKKAAAIAAAMDGEEAEEEEVAEAPSILDAAEALEPASEKTEASAKEEVAEEAPAEEEVSTDADYSSMTVAELKELLKAAGNPVSGKKADLITRLNE
jgi:hypothetical protein